MAFVPFSITWWVIFISSRAASYNHSSGKPQLITFFCTCKPHKLPHSWNKGSSHRFTKQTTTPQFIMALKSKQITLSSSQTHTHTNAPQIESFQPINWGWWRHTTSTKKTPQLTINSHQKPRFPRAKVISTIEKLILLFVRVFHRCVCVCVRCLRVVIFQRVILVDCHKALSRPTDKRPTCGQVWPWRVCVEEPKTLPL